MRIDIITVLPEMLEGFVHESILARAEKKGLAEIRLHNLRDYTKDKWRRVDDYPFGGQAGMVMQIEPIDNCIAALKEERDYDEVIFTPMTSPWEETSSFLRGITKALISAYATTSSHGRFPSATSS